VSPSQEASPEVPHQRRPLIGITSYLEEARWGVWCTSAALIPTSYIRAVEQAGGRALVIPPNREGAREVAEALNGLIISGGGDIKPMPGGEHPAIADVDELRDDAELALLDQALAREIPVLGICRGMQLLNVFAGGTLVPHVPDRVGHDGHKEDPGAFGSHRVRLISGSSLAALLGDEASVPSHHHQAVQRLGAGFVASAFAEDGLTEAIEDPQRSFCVGVQWHPEEGDDNSLFVELVRRAREGAWVAT
jgi:putative glutamine amidotransferase